MSSHRGHKRKIFTGIIFVVALFVFLNTTNVISFASPATAGIAEPFLTFGAYLERKSDNVFALMQSKIALEEENEKLKWENKRLEIELLTTARLEEENRDLRQLLGRGDTRETVLASVDLEPKTSLYDSLIIDVGKNNGIETGDLVVVFGDLPIGRIDAVFEHSARVALFSNHHEPTAVRIGGFETAVDAIGEGGGAFKIELPKEMTISKGDVIYYPDIQTRVFGVVESVTAEPSDPFQTVLFRHPFNINELRFVEVEI